MVVAGLAGALIEFAVYLVIHDLFRNSNLAAPLAWYVVTSLALLWLFSTYVTFSGGYRSRLGWHLAIGCASGASTGILLLGFARALWPLPTPLAAAEAAAGTVLAALYCVRWTRQQSRRFLAKVSRGNIPRRAASETYEACRHLIGNPLLSASARKTVMLNLARAAIVRCTNDDAPDGLVEAADVLRELLADPPPDWSAMMGAATELADASFVKADKHGDFSGYEDVLRLLAQTADRMPPDSDAQAIVHQKHAEYQLQLAGQLPPGPAASARLAQAVASWRAAIAVVPPHCRARLRVMHADIGEAIARAYPHLADPLGDLEVGIAECQTAVQLAGPSPRKRAPAQIRLAKLLVLRATERAASIRSTAPERVIREAPMALADIAEAERLLRLARKRGAAGVRASAEALLAATATFHAVMRGQKEAGGPQAIGEWRRAAEAMASAGPLERIQFAQGWVACAADAQDALCCAEAYWYLMRAVPEAVAVRYLLGQRERVLTDMQSTAEEAGYWLAEADRVGEAALALELGKAVSLTEVLSRDQPGFEAALRQAGHTELLGRYKAAINDYGVATRPGQDDGSSTPQRTWSKYAETLREVTTAIGADVPDALPTLAELSEAAHDGPLVYLAAASRGGYAIIVPPGGPPACLRLPRLTRSEVASRLSSFLRVPGLASVAEVMRQVAGTVHWLWDAGLGELASHLPAGALVTIVPVGLLSLMPVHAAGAPTIPGQEPGEWAFLADRVTIRYAPNARTLLHARAGATALPRDALSLLSVAAPEAVAGHRLRHAAREAEQVWRQWDAPANQRPVTSGAPRDVEPLLAERTVWHFACHCYARPDRILDSALILDGGELTLRAILTLPPAPRRLAVLSACETSRSGTGLPDEATGLPAGLIQAGFAGVVASHWPVNDWSTAYLMTRFHDLWHNHGMTPAAALAAAQRWFRAATIADLRTYSTTQLRGGTRLPAEPGPPDGRPFRHPFYWAPFALTGL